MQRYIPVAWDGGKAECHKDDRGEYVLHDDAQSRMAELEAEVARLTLFKKECRKTLNDVSSQRDTAWNDAIEAAADLAGNRIGQSLANEIRALRRPA